VSIHSFFLVWTFLSYQVMSVYPQPYNGAPPIPQGYNVNPAQWNTGVWQRNPHFNWNQAAAAQVPQASWVPGAAWNQPQQQQQSHNPYRRVVNPPSAAYLAQKLSDNPLGLTNMVPREQLYGPGVNGAPPETPWIWEPRALDDADSGSSNQPPHNLRQSSEPPSQSASQPQAHSLTRHASEPPPESGLAPLARPKKYAVSASAQASASKTSQPPPPQPPPVSSASAYASRAANSSSTAASASANTANPSRTLRPTFSPRIVRTPDYYSTRGPRDNDDPNTNSSLTRSATMPSITSSMNQMSLSSTSVSQSQATTTPARSQSTNTRRSASDATRSEAITDASMFVDEPGTLLSPLVMETPMPASSKPLGRHQTEPTLSSIPESTSSTRHHHHHHRRHSSRNSTPSKSNSKTPTPGEREGDSTSYFSKAMPGTSSASAAAAAAASRYTTPPSSANNSANMPTTSLSALGSRQPNPLPTPPRVVDNAPYSRSNLYSPPNSAATTPSRGMGVGSSTTTVSYTSPPMSAPAHGSSTTNYGIYPTSSSTSTITPSKVGTGISSASASASASAAQASSRSRSQGRTNRDRDRDRTQREPSRARDSGQIDRSYSYSSREPSRSRDPSSTRHSHSDHSRTHSREPSVSPYPSDRGRDANSYPFIAPDGTRPVQQTSQDEARILSELSSKWKIHGEPPKKHRERYEPSNNNTNTASGGSAAPSASAPATTTTFTPFPLPTPPESFMEQRRQDEERSKKEARDREIKPQHSQQSSYHYQSASSYPTSKTSPYANTNPSPNKSPSYSQNGQYPNGPSPKTHSRSASRHTSPYPSPNDAPQRSPYPSPYSTASSSHPSPATSPTKPSHASHGAYSRTSHHRRVRTGFWNSRGDHLTSEGYIVYAPGDKANPPELSNYPGQWNGFQDEQGRFVKFEVGRKELPESLPRSGRPPERSYDSFIRYV
jgi:hypothetical protein